MKYLPFLASALLFLGVAELPIGYYTFLRIAVCVIAIILLVNRKETRTSFFFIAFILIAIVFNPIFPVYLHDKGMWMVIDGVAGLVFLIYGVRYLKVIAET